VPNLVAVEEGGGGTSAGALYVAYVVASKGAFVVSIMMANQTTVMETRLKTPWLRLLRPCRPSGKGAVEGGTAPFRRHPGRVPPLGPWQRRHRLAETLRRGVAKTGGRSLETTNAWVTGPEFVAEKTAEYAEAVCSGVHMGDGVLTWRPIGHCEDLSDPVELRAGLVDLYADAPWMDIDRIMAEILDGGSHPADSRRFWLNQRASSDDARIVAEKWIACMDEEHKLEEGDTITLGFDGSHGRAAGNADATALVAVRVSDGHVELVHCWQCQRWR
jgi:hypothetical protein